MAIDLRLLLRRSDLACVAIGQPPVVNQDGTEYGMLRIDRVRNEVDWSRRSCCHLVVVIAVNDLGEVRRINNPPEVTTPRPRPTHQEIRLGDIGKHAAKEI